MTRPVPEGSLEELVAFEALQARLAPLFHAVVKDDRRPHTVIVIPSLSMNAQELAKISGVHHYEERLLYNLMLLRRPRTRLIFVTSQPIADPIVDYYLHLLSGVPGSHARKRLTLLACYDSSAVPLSRKVLDRPRMIQRIQAAVRTGDNCHMVCFNSSPLERSLAVQLGVPLYSTDPALSDLGTKSGCREIFKEAGVLLPDGFERLKDAKDITEALVTLKKRYPDLRRAVVKLNEGFSGEGNALFWFTGCPEGEGLHQWVRENLVNLKFEAKGETWETFEAKYEAMEGVVECFVEGQQKESPSCQTRVNPIGEPQVISTHDQVLGGPSGQVFLGCTFPAHDTYRDEIQEAGMRVAKVLAGRGVIGRFATDFVSVPKPDGGWDHWAIEVNLRKGGTTHPFLTLKFLTDGTYDRETGLFMTPTGQAKYYYASDTLQSEKYVGVTPDDLIDIAVYHGLHFHEASQRGVVFHLMGAMSEFGKLGVVCIGDNPQMAKFLYKKTVGVLDQETGNREDRGDSVSTSRSGG